ncbi:hypothetical protein [Streptomyces collinus]|uniref:hypothetical protein n=1 Tax=Streptomyces collinus TaxID=42684 RepID=UPI003318A6F7
MQQIFQSGSALGARGALAQYRERVVVLAQPQLNLQVAGAIEKAITKVGVGGRPLAASLRPDLARSPAAL